MEKLKEKFADWLLDIAKYVITAVIIASSLSNFGEWTIRGKVVAIVVVLLITIVGFVLSINKKGE
ncbi:MAG: hypothetical protein IJ759_07910 [Bacteroidales bacterium]|nr:hypothetical protein [Bacteroidales bacterium]MBR1775429.1 hypothetical protein [Bacteroidales bacterium]